MKQRKKYVKAHSHAPCPHCPAEKVGRELRNGVLTWRTHHRTTIAGRAIMCALSDQPVEETQ